MRELRCVSRVVMQDAKVSVCSAVGGSGRVMDTYRAYWEVVKDDGEA